ncbi:MAG: hypothetical protein IT204_13050 [Fimbriimonadaceae bacterium]|nr:hypothetical protein [Fimbriimonadaceae bacterium]
MPPSDRRTGRGPRCCGGCLLAAALLAGGLTWWLLRPAAPPPWRNPWSPVPDAQNAVAALPQIVSQAKLPTALSARGLSGASPAVRAWVATNAGTLDRLAQALDRPQCRWLGTPGGGALDFGPFYRDSRAAARMLLLRAKVRWQSGDMAAAAADLKRITRLGSETAKAPNSLIGYLVSIAVEAIGQRGLLTELGAPPLDLATADPTRRWPLPRLSAAQRQHLQAAARRLAATNAEPAGVIAALQAEGYYDPTTDGEQPLPHVALPRMLENRNRLLARAIREAGQPPGRRRPLPGANRAWDLSGSLAPVYQQALNASDRRRGQPRLVACAYAIRVYLDRHGRLPAKLDELVADGLLPAVPRDPFDDQPIRYRPRQGLLYLVGPDRVDAGGQRGEGGDDVPLRLPFVAAEATT